MLHAGGKFGDGGGYKVSGGLHGVGVSVVNALSEQLHLTVWRDGHEWTQSYERGAPKADLKKGAATDERGTTITFLPDLEIFDTIDYDCTILEQRFREMAFLTKGLQIELRRRARRGLHDERSSTTAASATSSPTCTRRASDPIHKKVVYFEDSSDVGQVEVAMQWNTSYQEYLLSASPTTSTRTRAARTCRASGPRSRAR